MTRQQLRICAIALAPGIVLLVLFFLPALALAASFSLSPRDVAEAIEAGAASLSEEQFGEEWLVAFGGESVAVTTPFSRLALAARNAAFKGEPLTPSEIQKILDRAQGRIYFVASLRGRQSGFARFYEAVLLAKGREVKPVFSQNERTAAHLEDGGFLARCLYAFPTEGLDPRGQLTLVIREPKGQEVFRGIIDLAKMR